ncbi:MAG: hypothetical protein ACLQJL_15030, partial [Roseiarcus sp.]
GSVMNEPPPASAFCAPAHSAAMNRTSKLSTPPPISFRRARDRPSDPDDRPDQAVHAMRE